MSDSVPKTQRRGTARRRRDCRTILHQRDLRILRSATPTTEIVRGEIHDLSPQGVGLRMTVSLEIGETLLVEIREPGRLCLNVAADVVWQKEDGGGGFLVGCRLRQRISRSKMELIRQLIQDLAIPEPQVA